MDSETSLTLYIVAKWWTIVSVLAFFVIATIDILPTDEYVANTLGALWVLWGLVGTVVAWLAFILVDTPTRNN